MEAARNIDVVLFDKTGTLTKGEYGVDAVLPVDGESEADVLRLAASVNSHSEHPIAKALVSAAVKRNLGLTEASQFQRVPGKGARAWIAGSELFVGSQTLLADLGIALPAELEKKLAKLTQQGKTAVFVIAGGKLRGSIALADQIRDESREAIKTLKKLNVQTAMITGDSDDVAAWVSQELGIDQHFAKVLPEQKAEKVKLLQSKGLRVAMVGDGVNDAPALSQADLGIAIGAGTNVAIESAGIILVKNDPRDIPKVIKLSKLTYSKMMQNLFWATGYNVIALPLAAGILAKQGILLQPALAAVFMSLSTVIVALNALLLRRQKI